MYSLKKSLYSLYVHSFGSDVGDHFFWSEYRVNRTRFHSLSSEFSLWPTNTLELESSEIHSSTSEISSLHIDGVNYSLDLFLESIGNDV